MSVDKFGRNLFGIQEEEKQEPILQLPPAKTYFYRTILRFQSKIVQPTSNNFIIYDNTEYIFPLESAEITDYQISHNTTLLINDEFISNAIGKTLTKGDKFKFLSDSYPPHRTLKAQFILKSNVEEELVIE